MAIKLKSFDLRNTPACILHVPARTDRALNVQNALQNVGLTHASFVSAAPGDAALSGAVSYGAICEAIARKDPFTPVLVLEDDVNVTPHFKAEFSVPEDVDAVYLGLSACSVSPDKDYFQNGICWNNVPDTNVRRVLNMLSTHAILICSRRYAVFAAKAAATAAAKKIIWDIPFARRLSRFNVYAFNEPFFYQDSTVGGNEAATRITMDSVKRLDFFEQDPPGWELFGFYDKN